MLAYPNQTGVSITMQMAEPPGPGRCGHLPVTECCCDPCVADVLVRHNTKFKSAVRRLCLAALSFDTYGFDVKKSH